MSENLSLWSKRKNKRLQWWKRMELVCFFRFLWPKSVLHFGKEPKEKSFQASNRTFNTGTKLGQTRPVTWEAGAPRQEGRMIKCIMQGLGRGPCKVVIFDLKTTQLPTHTLCYSPLPHLSFSISPLPFFPSISIAVRRQPCKFSCMTNLEAPTCNSLPLVNHPKTNWKVQ